MSEFTTLDQHLAGEPRPPVILPAPPADAAPLGNHLNPAPGVASGQPPHPAAEGVTAFYESGSPAAEMTSAAGLSGSPYPASAVPAGSPVPGNPYSEAAAVYGAPTALHPYPAVGATPENTPALSAVPPGVPPAAVPTGPPVPGVPYPVAGQPLPFAGQYPPLPAGTRPHKDAGAYFRAVLAQFKSLFKPEMCAVLSDTKESRQGLLYLFWLPLYLLLGPLLLTPLFELFYLPLSGLAAYASALLLLLLGLGIALGVAALFASFLKSPLRISELMNLLMATTLPLILVAPPVALLLYPLPFLSMFLCLTAFFWHELLLADLYKRFIGVQRFRAGNWLILAAFALRLLLGALLLYVLDYFLLA